MKTQPEALRLAEVMSLTFPGNKGIDMAATELRRLHELNQELVEALKDLLEDTEHKHHSCGDKDWCPVLRAHAAIAKATGFATKTGETE